LNRRRFLKYAGTGAIAVGVSALGADLLFSPMRLSVPTNRTSSALESSLVSERSVVSTVASQTTTRNTVIGPELIFETDFRTGSLDRFWGEGGVDESSIPCNKLPPPTRRDFEVSVVDDRTAPTGQNKALQLVTNVQGKPGLTFNAIIARHTDFEDNSTYTTYGILKRMPSDVENICVNQCLVENYVGYDCAFGWVLNPYAEEHYGWVLLRTKKSVESNAPFWDKWGEKIHLLGDDTRWHYFEIEGRYVANPKARKITRLRIDDSEYKSDEDMWSYPQTWSDSFWSDLETANMDVNCSLSKKSTGISRLCKLGLIRQPI
jgi:hypothetical protein